MFQVFIFSLYAQIFESFTCLKYSVNINFVITYICIVAFQSNASIEITPLPAPNTSEESSSKIITLSKIAQSTQAPKFVPNQITVKKETKEVNGSEADEPLSCVKKEGLVVLL